MYNQDTYQKAYQKTLDKLKELYKQYCTEKQENIGKKMYKMYKDKTWNLDGKANQYVADVICTADAILSFNRICKMEEREADIVPIFEKYRKVPIIFPIREERYQYIAFSKI